jgi:hypothetical protein
MADGDLLRRAAERAAQRPFYLASVLLAYARAERLDDAGLASRLGCDPASLPHLLLCRRPTGEGIVFRADVEAIARRFTLDARRLRDVIRAADALVSLQAAAPDKTGGLLAAARDRNGDGHAVPPVNRVPSEDRQRPDTASEEDDR